MQIQVLQRSHDRLHRNPLQLIGPGKKGLAFCEVAQISQNKNYFQRLLQLTLRRNARNFSTKNFSEGHEGLLRRVRADKSRGHLVNNRRWYADHSNIIRWRYPSYWFRSVNH